VPNFILHVRVRIFLKKLCAWAHIAIATTTLISALCSISFKRLLHSHTVVLQMDSFEQKCHGWFCLVKYFQTQHCTWDYILVVRNRLDLWQFETFDWC